MHEKYTIHVRRATRPSGEDGTVGRCMGALREDITFQLSPVETGIRGRCRTSSKLRTTRPRLLRCAEASKGGTMCAAGRSSCVIPREGSEMSTLTQEQIDELSRIMDARWESEMNEIRAVVERARDDRRQAALLGRPADRLDEALREIAQEAPYAIVRQNVQDVQDIEGARQRIAAGTYGICIDCGGDIGYERLLAYPTAKRCIRCQREHERRRAGG